MGSVATGVRIKQGYNKVGLVISNLLWLESQWGIKSIHFWKLDKISVTLL